MSLQYFGHPFSSYTQKVLIALWADETPFEYRMIAPDHPENMEELKRHSPYGLFPLLIDDSRAVFESSTIIEHLQAHHPGPNAWIPEGETGRRVRFLDRFFDLYVMGNMQKAGNDILRLCVEVGGCLTGEHGVGIEKRDLMHHQFTETDLAQQMRIRSVFDRDWLLNPAKVFPLGSRHLETV